MEIAFEAKVRSADDQSLGTVGHIVVDSNTKGIVAFILNGNRTHHGDPIVPIELVTRSDADGTLHLSLPADAVMHLSEFEQDKFVVHEDAQKTQWNYLVPTGTAGMMVPSASFGGSVEGIRAYDPGGDSFFGVEDPTNQEISTWSNLPEWDYRIGRGAKVLTRDDHTVGTLHGVNIGEDGKPLGIDVISGHIHHTQHYIPIELIRSADSQQVLLNLTRDEYREKESEFTQRPT
jgi:uncharacterized protein YrrD